MVLKMKRPIDTHVYFNRSLGKHSSGAPCTTAWRVQCPSGGSCHADCPLSCGDGLLPAAGLSSEPGTVTPGRAWPGPEPASPQPCTACGQVRPCLGHAGGGGRRGHRRVPWPRPLPHTDLSSLHGMPSSPPPSPPPPFLTGTTAAGSKDPCTRPPPAPPAHTVIWPGPV